VSLLILCVAHFPFQNLMNWLSPRWEWWSRMDVRFVLSIPEL
jgi:hypothetical protein